jgi:UDPglucose 6-dehydrogenase
VSRDAVIGFAGLTHLGLVSAAVAAARGFSVVGFDPDPGRVAASASGRLPIAEPGLDALVRDQGSRLDFTRDPARLAGCDVVCIARDVPTVDGDASDLGPIWDLVHVVLPALGPAATLVVLSQVPPGFTRSVDLPAGRLFYQVETLVVGRAVERATRPERFIVGCADPETPLPPRYAEFLGAFGCPVLPMRYESAELSKIAINCCLAASVTVANTLAELSERIGADWGEIAPALRLDHRIGEHAYLSPGLGIAGGNLERDLVTVLRLAAATGSEASAVAAFQRNSAHRRDWVLRTLHAEVLARQPDAVVGILGLAYKAETQSTKNSPALELVEHLAPWRLQVYDPVVPTAVVRHPAVRGARSPLDAARGAHALAVMTPWPEFRELEPADLGGVMAGRTLVDPHRVLGARSSVAAGLDYFTLGAPPRRARAG